MPIKVLAIFSAPWGKERLNIRKERDKLFEALKKSKHSHLFEVTPELHITLNKFEELLEQEPDFQLIHFSGHSNKYYITFEDDNGKAQPVPLNAFVKLIEAYKTSSNQLKCMIFNSCYSFKLGEELSKLGICTISMKDEIKETAANFFTEGFYSKFSMEYTISNMFENAKEKIHRRNLHDWKIPELKGNGQIKFKIISIPYIPPELEYSIEDEKNPDFERVNNVYIEPKGYENALKILQQEKFLIITGPPNIGKTSTAYKLANTIKREYDDISLIFTVRNEPTKVLKQIKNSIIIFDDIFGKAKFENEFQANEFIEYQKLRNYDNYLIYTTREEILLKAKISRTKFAEIPNLDDYTFKIEQEGFYDDIALEKILDNHLNYYLKQDDITINEKEIAKRNLPKIIKNLRFPHNYKELVELELMKVSKNTTYTIDNAIENAKHIKRAVESWFVNIDDKSIKYFILILALFNNLTKNKHDFGVIYKNVIRLLKQKYSNIDIMKIEHILENPIISIYIHIKGDNIDFSHPHYWEGVINGVLTSCTEEMDIIKPILREMMFYDDIYIRHAIANNFGMIGRVIPKFVIPLLNEMIIDRDLLVRQSVARSLGEIGEVEPELVLPLLKKMFEDEHSLIRYYIAGNFIDIIKIKPEIALPFLKKTVLTVQDSKMYNQLSLYIGKIGIIKTELVLSILRELMSDKDWKIRLFVANTLRDIARIKPEIILPSLKKMENDNFHEIRNVVIVSYSEISKLRPNLVIPLFKEMLNDENKGIRNLAFKNLEKIGQFRPELIFPIIYEMVKKGNPMVPNLFPYNLMRIHKIKTKPLKLLLKEIENDKRAGVPFSIGSSLAKISELKPEIVVSLLKEMGTDKYLNTRMSIAKNIDEIGKEKPELIIPILYRMIEDENDQARYFVVNNLSDIGKIHQELLIPSLKKLVIDKSGMLRRRVAILLGDIGKIKPELIIPLVKEMIFDEDYYVRRYIVDSLWKIGKVKPELVMPLLKEMVNDKDSDVRHRIADTLGDIGRVSPDLVMPLLKEMINEDEFYVWGSIASAFGKIGKKWPDLVIPLLKEIINDKDMKFRGIIAYVFGVIGKVRPDLVIPLLKEMINDKDMKFRESIADALGDIGNVRPDLVIPLLNKMINDESYYVRDVIAENFYKLGKDTVLPLLKEITNNKDRILMIEQLIDDVETRKKIEETTGEKIWRVFKDN